MRRSAIKSQKYCQYITVNKTFIQQPALLGGISHLLAILIRTLLLFLPIFSIQPAESWEFNSFVFDLLIRNTSSLLSSWDSVIPFHFFTDQLYFGSKPLLSGHLPFPGGWPLYRSSTVYHFLIPRHNLQIKTQNCMANKKLLLIVH